MKKIKLLCLFILLTIYNVNGFMHRGYSKNKRALDIILDNGDTLTLNCNHSTLYNS